MVFIVTTVTDIGTENSNFCVAVLQIITRGIALCQDMSMDGKVICALQCMDEGLSLVFSVLMKMGDSE